MNNNLIVEKIESYLSRCPNVDNGSCDLAWKHEDCKVLMEILYDLTEDERYQESRWIFNPGQQLLWE